MATNMATNMATMPHPGFHGIPLLASCWNGELLQSRLELGRLRGCIGHGLLHLFQLLHVVGVILTLVGELVNLLKGGSKEDQNDHARSRKD